MELDVNWHYRAMLSYSAYAAFTHFTMVWYGILEFNVPLDTV